jgi:hypothetical protein
VKLRLAFFIMCVALLLAALEYERHEVLPLSAWNKKSGAESGAGAGRKLETGESNGAKVLSGLEFTQDATVDGFLLKDGVVYDVYSLVPLSSEGGVALTVEKKCPT